MIIIKVFRKLKVAILTSFVFALAVSNLYSQNANISVSRDSILIGEQLELKLSVTCDFESNVIIPWASIYDSLSTKFEIINYGAIDTVFSSETSERTLFQKLLITSWEEGLHIIYPFEFACKKNDEITHFESEALLISVWFIDVDDELPPRDIKYILYVPISFREILPWIIMLILLSLTMWLLYKYRNKFKKSSSADIIKMKPDVPAHVIALEELEKLKKKKLWQEGKIKLFHVELSTIIRYYIELRFGVMAMEMTTDETLNNVSVFLSEQPEQLKNLDKILLLADLVKFAKHQPLGDENQKNLDIAFDFVNNTMLLEEKTNTEDLTDKNNI